MSSRKEKYMKVFAINSSTRPDSQSKTALLLDYLVQGMREAGAEVDLVKLREKKDKVLHRLFYLHDKDAGALHP